MASSAADAAGSLFVLDRLGAASGLRHAITTRRRPPGPWGPAADWNLRRRGADPAVAAANWAALFAATGVPPERMVAPQQVHGAEVVVVGAPDAGKGLASGDPGIRGADALITATPGLFLLTGCADCVPVFVYDPVRRAIGLAHAGWRGTAARIAEKTVRAMGTAFGTDPADCLAAIGPAIGPCCYDVGQDVIDEVRDAYPEADDEWRGEPPLLIWSRRLPAWRARRGDAPDGEERVYLDLWAANRRALLLAGVPGSRIECPGLCTADHVDRFYSHRAEEGRAGRFMALLGLAPDGAAAGSLPG